MPQHGKKILCCPTGPETHGVPSSYRKARHPLPPTIALPVTRKNKRFAMVRMKCIFHLCYGQYSLFWLHLLGCYIQTVNFLPHSNTVKWNKSELLDQFKYLIVCNLIIPKNLHSISSLNFLSCNLKLFKQEESKKANTDDMKIIAKQQRQLTLLRFVLLSLNQTLVFVTEYALL